MSQDRQTPAAAAQSKRRIARCMMALTSAAFISGVIALPASAATAPALRTAVPGVLSDVPPADEDNVDFGGGAGPDAGLITGGDGGNSDDVWSDPDLIGGNGGDNPHRQAGGGAYGPNTCEPGYVWRDSFDGDALCVTPEERTWAKSGIGERIG
ncbi:hypothetical protein ACFVFI_16255 [Streptomyces sp. NPDC057705]|uniref:hypothetical protein n=1 Tax=Streptomyces sp. NPDC057705 TaxID=3346222 RepID=UPI00367D1F4F